MKVGRAERDRQAQKKLHAPRRGGKPRVSALCRSGRHSPCYSVNCTCACHYPLGACGYVDKSVDNS